MGVDLPFDDPAVAALSSAQRAAIAGHWGRRARAELQVGRAYAAVPVQRPQIDSVVLPRFDVGDEALECTLLVAGMCCINETVATAWISSCLSAAEAPLAVAANRFHLRD